MRSTLFISESENNYAKRISDILALLLGPGRSVDINALSRDVDHYKNIVFTICFNKNYIAEKTLLYIKDMRNVLKDKKIVMLVILEDESDSEEFKSNIIESLGKKPDVLEFMIGKVEEKELLKIAHNIAEKLNKNSKKIDNIVYILEKLKNK
ncbi:hypothetical protein CM240_1025 [Clostridium bornimense]|uniref:Uncharacterized protein n=1 Tax=Clostridium bornimense TaxID=1216932 RepID=W6RX27_9CLOT|nr:hypothetical protein [Clostridium bornimense]CDM68189.1 hypothetical protein CM240_1025 [Clostridium bornimense]